MKFWAIFGQQCSSYRPNWQYLCDDVYRLLNAVERKCPEESNLASYLGIYNAFISFWSLTKQLPTSGGFAFWSWVRGSTPGPLRGLRTRLPLLVTICVMFALGPETESRRLWTELVVRDESCDNLDFHQTDIWGYHWYTTCSSYMTKLPLI